MEVIERRRKMRGESWSGRLSRWRGVDFCIAGLFLFLGAKRIYSLQSDVSWLLLLWLGLYTVRNLTVTALYLVRRPWQTVSTRPVEWLVAVAGTFVLFLWEPSKVRLVPDALLGVTVALLLVSEIFSLWGHFNLGRSFGIAPANRGIKIDGLYSLCRHPIYCSYFVHDLCRVLVFWSPWNGAIFLVFVVLQVWRAKNEEAVLMQDPAYREYAKKTRCMFVPGVI